MRQVCETCNGCSACYLSCPTNAISLLLNSKGFYQAYIDEEKCVNCGNCNAVCVACKDAKYDIAKSQHYVGVSSNREILKKSSSGGIAFLLASYIVNSGGVACAVGYNVNDNNAQHYIYKDIISLQQSQGSKYLQSNNSKAFAEAINTKGDVVVFGTPCQIAGLYEVLMKKGEKERFLLVDIFCHGVPSTKLWRNHLKDRGVQSHNNISGPSFRNNKKFILKYSNYRKWYNQDGFMMLYLMNKYLNASCYACPYRRKSSSDIRLGDLMSDKYSNLWYSPSCICVNTQKGIEALEGIKDQLEIYGIDYGEIDQIQQKEILMTPEEVNPKYKKLEEQNITPRGLLGFRYYKNYAKSFIKIPLILLRERFFTDDLESSLKKEKK